MVIVGDCQTIICNAVARMIETGMRKIFLFMTISLDGYFEGIGHDLSWHNVHDDINKFSIELLKEVDLLIFGRRIYQLMEDAWPKIAEDTASTKDNIEIARLINTTNKFVFSKTLDVVSEQNNWRNVKLIQDFDAGEIRRLKDQPGKEISVSGSDLALSFIKAGLIDEFRFMIAPVALGAGTPIFKGLKSKLDLELIKTCTFESGNILLYYKPAKNQTSPA